MSARRPLLSLLAVAWVALSAPLIALAQPASIPPATSSETTAHAPAGADYVLGPGDVIEAQVLGRADFNARGRIAADGSIQLPFVGTLAAGNKTTTEFSADIAKALEGGGYFSHPVVTVDVVVYASRYVIVLGAVTSPGLVPVDRAYRLSEILARVGGVRDSAADYVVLRPEGGKEQRLSIAALATGGDADDPYVSPGDKIYAPPAEMFFISGEVKAPGAYPVISGMTLRMAIARGGGLTDEGSDHGVKVTHKGGQPEQPGLETKIMPSDVIVVGERLF